MNFALNWAPIPPPWFHWWMWDSQSHTESHSTNMFYPWAIIEWHTVSEHAYHQPPSTYAVKCTNLTKLHHNNLPTNAINPLCTHALDPPGSWFCFLVFWLNLDNGYLDGILCCFSCSFITVKLPKCLDLFDVKSNNYPRVMELILLILASHWIIA